MTIGDVVEITGLEEGKCYWLNLYIEVKNEDNNNNNAREIRRGGFFLGTFKSWKNTHWIDRKTGRGKIILTFSRYWSLRWYPAMRFVEIECPPFAMPQLTPTPYRKTQTSKGGRKRKTRKN